MLKNKLNLTDAIELARAEEKISKLNAINLWQSNDLQKFEAGSFQTLAHIHKILFDEIYEFAGEIRNENISKDHFRFASALYLPQILKVIEQMPQKNFIQIIEKYIEMNIAHPFREGNGRSMRLWLDDILKRVLKQVIDWQQIPRENYLSAMKISPIDPRPLELLLAPHLTKNISDRMIFFKGLDTSYFYENYYAFRSENL